MGCPCGGYWKPPDKEGVVHCSDCGEIAPFRKVDDVSLINLNTQYSRTLNDIEEIVKSRASDKRKISEICLVLGQLNEPDKESEPDTGSRE